MENVKKIPLTRNQFAIVDIEDFDELNKHKWQCSFYGYAVRDINNGKRNRKEGRRVCVKMHQCINKAPEGLITDHINRNKLDNRRCNLRSVSPSQNSFNSSLSKNNTSGCVGIVWRKDIKKWSARIKVNYKEIYLGCFKDKNDAIKARKQAEDKYFKDIKV
jgi:hypothetical protein